MEQKNYLKPTRQLFCRFSYLAMLMVICTINSIAQVVTTITASGSFTVPAGVTSLKVEAWGTGGSGGGATGTGILGLTIAGGGGGGGGAYNVSTLAVSPGQVYSITIGATGSTGTGTGGAGGATTVTGPGGSLTANGGAGGGGNNGGGGAGGIGNRNGGAGGPGAGGNGAGGGGGAGNNGNGTAGTNGSAGTGGSGNPNVAPYTGGNGGANQGNNGSNGNTGIIPGGGGGGGRGYSLDNANGGAGARGQVVITYTLPPPVITSLGSTGGCVGNAITINGSNLTGAVAANVTIGGTPVTAIISNTGTQITATIGSGTTGTVSVTTSSGTATSAATFSVFSLPAAPSVTPPSATVIAGQTTSFTASGSGAAFAWFNALTGGTLLASTPSYTPPASCSNATFYAQQTSSQGCVSSRTATTLVRTPLAAPTGTNGSICGLGSVTISTVPAAGGNTSNWYDAPTGGNLLSSNNTAPFVTITASGSYTFYASTVNSAVGCESPSRTAVTAASLPQLITNPAVTPAAVCPGSSVTLSSGVSRSGKSTVDYPITDGGIFGGTTPVSSPLEVSGFSPSLNNSSVKINFVKINITHTFVGDLRIRLVAPDNTFINLSNQNGGSGDNYINTVFQTGGTAITSGVAPFTGIFAPQQGFANFNGKNPNGTWNLNVTDMAFLDAGNLLDWEINFVDGNGITYSWTSSPAGFTSSLPNPAVTPTAGTVYNITTNGPGGCTTNASLSPAVSPVPVVSAISNAPVCVGANLFLFGNNSGSGQASGNTYSWTGPNSFSSSQQNPSIGSAASNHSGIYTLTITNQSGCSSSSTTAIAVNPNPVLSVASVTNAGCIGSTDGCIDIDANNGTPLYLYDLGGNSNLDGIYCDLAAGVYNVTVIDDNGCEGNVNATVIEEDLTDPVIICPANVTVNTTPALCEGIATWTQPVGTDNCAGAVTTLTNGLASGSSFPVGTTPVTYTVTDGFNNSSTCSFNVTVADNENPAIACPANVTVNNTPSLCEGIATFVAPIGTDNCTGAFTSQTGGPASGTSFPVGTTPIIYTVTDAANNSATCSFNVVVVDNENPVIACPAHVTVNNTSSLCEGIATFIAPVGTDNCTGAFTAQTGGLTSGSPFPVGTTPITYTVTDAANNSSVCSFNVVVVDNENPVIACPANVTVNNTPSLCEGIATFAAPVGTDNCTGALTTLTSGFASGSSFPVGTTPVTYTVTDAANNSATCSFNVVVADNENPVIACPANVTVNNTPSLCEGIATFIAPVGTDNCMGAFTSQTGGLVSGSSFPVGTTPITYTVTDAANNSATCSFNVVVVDNENPVVACPANVTVNNTPSLCEGIATFVAPVGTDNCTGAFTSQTGGLSSGSSFPVGTTPITYTVTDEANNSATCSFNVIVVDNENPVIACPANVTVNNTPSLCEGIATFTVPAGTDNCSGAFTTLTSGFASGSSFPVGTTTITYTVTDVANNSATCSFNVTVVDNENPVITCPANVTVNNTPSLCAGIAAWTQPVGTDNCSGAFTSLTGGLASGSSFPVGTTPITYTVTDAANNSATCSFNVTVVDNENPVITCPANVTVNNTPSLCEGIATFVAPVGTDNCTGAFTSQTGGLSSGSSFPVGTTPITYTVTDAANNSSLCSFNVVVVDNENPVIACPANVTVNNTPSICEGTVTFVPPVGTDNCSGALTTLTSGFASGSSFPVGITPIIYTVTDAANNSATCSFNVTVIDNENPVITCPANVAVNSTSGSCEGIAAWTAPLGTDNCSGVFTAQTGGPASGSSFSVGITPITYTVTDASNNSATCSFNVVVIDNQAPDITCPPDVIINNDPGFCYATAASLGNPTTGDNCGISGISNNAPAQFPVGATIVDWEVEDLSGNKSQCQQFVIVQDNENPVISGMPSNITFTTSPADCFPSISWAAPTTADNCSISSFTSDYNPGDEFPEGTTTVIYTAIDINGNSVTASFTITIVAQPLTVVATGTVQPCGYNISCNGGNNGQASAAVTGGCLPYTYLWSNGNSTTNLSGLTAGTYTVTVTDGNGHVTVQTVTLTQPPALVVTLGPDQSYEFACTCANLVPAITGGSTCQPVAYAWSTGASTPTLTVCPTQTASYTVTVTDINGCISTDVVSVIKPALVGQLDRYVVLGTGTQNDNIGSNTVFNSGAAGHRLATGSITLSNNGNINTWIAGNNVIIGNNSTVATLYRNTASIGNNAIIGTTITPVTVPLTSKVPCFPTFSGGANINVPSGTTLTISPGTYNNITTGNNSILRMNAGVYYVNSISTGNGGSIIPNGTGVTAKDVIVFVKTTMTTGNQGNIHGNFYSQGAMNLGNGNNTTGTYQGAFYGKPVTTGNNLNFHLDSYCYSTLPLCNSKLEGENVAETSSGIFNLYPNPTNGEFTLQYSGSTGSVVDITIVNTTGQVVYQRKVYEFNGIMEQAFELSNLTPGIYTLQIHNGNELSNKKFMVVH